MNPSIAEHYREVLVGLDENPEREGLTDTPKRAVQAIQYLGNGYTLSLEDDHHLLSFIGKAHLAYHLTGLE